MKKIITSFIFIIMFVCTSCSKQQETTGVVLNILSSCVEDWLQSNIAVNDNDTLRVPTMINKIDDTYYIVDCYHDSILYSKDINKDLNSWYKISGGFLQPHCFVGDGKYFIVVDTENNRLVTYIKVNDSFMFIESIDNIGSRPHYAMHYNDKYYVWDGIKSINIYVERDYKLILEKTYEIPELEWCYVRSFSIIDGEWYFPTSSGKIVVTNSEFDTVREYYVPDDIAGLSYLYKRDNYWYVHVFTNIEYDTSYTDLVICKDLSQLETGEYESVYDEWGLISSPYYVYQFDGSYYMATLSGYSAIYRLDVIDGEISCVKIF